MAVLESALRTTGPIFMRLEGCLSRGVVAGEAMVDNRRERANGSRRVQTRGFVLSGSDEMRDRGMGEYFRRRRQRRSRARFDEDRRQRYRDRVQGHRKLPKMAGARIGPGAARLEARAVRSIEIGSIQRGYLNPHQTSPELDNVHHNPRRRTPSAPGHPRSGDGFRSHHAEPSPCR